MSYADANRRYFDAISDSYDSKPWFAKTNNLVTDALRSDLAWIGVPLGAGEARTAEIRLLDYACGTGLMTRVFGPYVTRTTGIDISPNMVSTYNQRARDVGLAPDTVSAVVGNLFDKADASPASLSGPEFWNFDLATVGFGFHHFEDVVFAASQLRERLRPGGVLLISDFLEGGDVLADEKGDMIEGSEGNHAVHDHHHHHHHHGHGHGHGHGHSHEQDSGSKKHDSAHDSSNEKHDVSDTSASFQRKMAASVVVPHFTKSGVQQFFTEAGFVDVDVITMKEKCYMEFAGKKLWRTVLFARGRKPLGNLDNSNNDNEKSEL
ncbi:uncharacterized protein SETTUDRAFT_101730 [Exserohilum turcica Et28A]|uniref:S-adenosyl-L-methionine-dependent methyltransferase n=1 Tax=Exserohilum turcicum (strain 28A) TaxID=671987 RepID=R0KDB9_EXST2|nr:uncharacterized protein SETTUDRAFT_101730 [Exserohilum turcica Et28A]EOA90913.1 hypothetical protein SETTUDRAFT_101730 [Exserohilum turcica Et28A]